MKTILVIIVGSLVSVNALAQEPQKDKSKPKATPDITVTFDAPAIEPPKISVNYPECNPKPPKVTLQRSLMIAEKLIRTEKINVTSHYLARVLLVCDATAEVIRWEFTWRSEQKPNVEIDVTMNAKARQVPARTQSIM